MMARTTRHCRYLHRQFSTRARLFTEMIAGNALIHGPGQRLLAFHPAEQPLVCQLGGADPGLLAEAAALTSAAGFCEINLNAGCPAPRVRRGGFGAVLMTDPDLAAACVQRMAEAACVPVTVKCRLGVDQFDSDAHLHRFVDAVSEAGARTLYMHARKALLNGLSPAQNRRVPPLQPERVYRVKARFPDLRIILNGGIHSTAQAQTHLQHVDGVMVGRAAWRDPGLLAQLDARLFGAVPGAQGAALAAYLAYAENELALGTPFPALTRPMAGLFRGLPGARRFRQALGKPPGADAGFHALRNVLAGFRELPDACAA